MKRSTGTSGHSFRCGVVGWSIGRLRETVGCPVRTDWSGVEQRDRVRDQAEVVVPLIGRSLRIETLSGQGYPSHFFQVEINNVARHAAPLLLNREAVRNYIGEVCPVPIDPEFPFASKVESLFEEGNSLTVLNVLLDNESTPIARRFGRSICFSADREDSFTGFEDFYIPAVDGTGNAAVGWMAHSSYLGAIPKEAGIRCRKASMTRNNQRKLFSKLSQLEEAYDLAISGYLSSGDAKALIAQAWEAIQDVRGDAESMNGDADAVQLKKFTALETKLNSFRVRHARSPFKAFKGIPASEIAVYRKVCQALTAMSRSPRVAKETMETILAQTC